MEDCEEEIDLSDYKKRIKQIKKKYAPLVIGMDNVEGNEGVKSYNYKNNSYDKDGNRFNDEGQDYGDLNLDDEVNPEVLEGEDSRKFTVFYITILKEKKMGVNMLAKSALFGKCYDISTISLWSEK